MSKEKKLSLKLELSNINNIITLFFNFNLNEVEIINYWLNGFLFELVWVETC